MIITCDKCSTSFNLDDSLVKENGSNVRCSVCKNIFTAYPASREPELDEPSALILENETGDDLALDSGMDEELSLDAPDDFDMDDSEFSINEPELEMEASELEIDEPGLEMESSALEIDEPGLEMESSALEIDEPILEMESSEMEMEDDDLDAVTEYAETESEDSVLEMDSDFSFEETELELQTDTDEDNQMEGGQLEFEDDGINFEAGDDDDLDGLEFEPYKEDDDSEPLDSITMEEDKGELEFEDDGIEFDEESTLEMETQDQGLELEIDRADDSEDIVTLENEPRQGDEEEEFELEFDVEEETDSQTLEMETRPEEGESSLTLDDDTKEEGPPPTITPEDDFSGYDEAQEREIDSESDMEEETIEIDDVQEDEGFMHDRISDLQPPPIPRKKRRKKKPLISAPVLFLLLILFLVAGAYIASIMTGYKIPYLSDIKIPFIENLLKTSQFQKTASTLTLTEKKDWNGRFVDNETVGRLFIITGRIQNISSTPLNNIKVKGILQTKNNQIIKTKEVYCGNILSEETLKNATMETINKELDVKDGRHKLNVNIQPGATVEYMIVFDDLSENLDNFLVKAP